MKTCHEKNFYWKVLCHKETGFSKVFCFYRISLIYCKICGNKDILFFFFFFCTHVHPLPTTQEKTHTWTSPDCQHWNQTDKILCIQRWRSFIQSAKSRPRTDCGSDHELLIAKFRLKLKKVGKTNSPFRYDLNQIPYDYTVEVRNRFKGLDMIDREPDELWMEVCDIVQETGIKTIPKKKKCKKQNRCQSRPYK